MCVVATRPHSQEDLKRHRIVSISSVECGRSEEHTSELQSQSNLACRLLLEKKKKEIISTTGCVAATRAQSDSRDVPALNVLVDAMVITKAVGIMLIRTHRTDSETIRDMSCD